MPIVRKLSSQEIDHLRRRGHRLDLTAYSEAISGLEVGDWGAIELQDGDLPVLTIKRRYSLAATAQGKRLVYKRKRGAMLPFEVSALVSSEPKPSPPTARPPQRG